MKQKRILYKSPYKLTAILKVSLFSILINLSLNIIPTPPVYHALKQLNAFILKSYILAFFVKQVK